MSNHTSNWHHGYYARDGYTHGYYREMSPLHIAWAAMLQGVHAPRTNFRYVDLGCGQGFNLILNAAIHPDSQFVGIDFMPKHVLHAQRLADAAGLKNIRFIEADFMDLMRSPHSIMDATGESVDGQCDYVVAHGIATWIAPEVRNALINLAGRLLRPGGIHYTSYNTLPGWLAMIPFQGLILEHQRMGLSGGEAIKRAIEQMDKLEVARTAYPMAQPTLKSRLETIRKQDPAYLTQEFSNEFWQPLPVAEMMRATSAVKLEWLGSATLPEAFDSLLPKGAVALMQEAPDSIMRETLRDLAVNQAFRRDLYVKGKLTEWPRRRVQDVAELRVIASPFQRFPEAEGGKIEISTPAGKVKAEASTLQSILTEAGGVAGVSIEDLNQRTGGSGIADTVQKVSLMMHAGWMQLRPTVVANAVATNRAICQGMLNGAPYQFIAAPGIGQAANCDPLQALLWLSVDEALKSPGSMDAPDVEKVRSVLNVLRKGLNISLKVGEQNLSEGPAFDTEIDQRIQQFLNKTPLWRALGVI